MKTKKFTTLFAVCVFAVSMMLFVAGCENGKKDKDKDKNQNNDSAASTSDKTTSGSNSGSGTKFNFEVPKFDSSTIFDPSKFCFHCGTDGGKHASNCQLLNIKK